MNSARHVIKRILTRRCMSYTASYDVASTIHQSLGFGYFFIAFSNVLFQVRANPPRTSNAFAVISRQRTQIDSIHGRVRMPTNLN